LIRIADGPEIFRDASKLAREAAFPEAEFERERWRTPRAVIADLQQRMRM